MDYVGTDTADTTVYVQEVYNKISQLRQVWKYGKGRMFTDTPEDLYQKYLNHSVILQDNASSWPLQLPPTYLSLLENKFRPRIIPADDFNIPNLSVLHTKSNQLQVILEFCNTEVKFSTRMEEDIEHWHKLLKLHQPEHNREKCALFMIELQHNAHNGDLSEPPQQHHQKPQPILFQKSSYLAEQNISQY